MKKKIVSVFLVVILFSSKAFPAASGTTVFESLKLPENAFQASVGSVSSVWGSRRAQSLASLALKSKYTIELTHAEHFQDVKYNILDCCIPLHTHREQPESEPNPNNPVISINYKVVDYGTMPRVTELPDGDYEKNGFFSAKDYCMQIRAGYPAFKTVYAGVGIKYACQNIDGSSISGVAADVDVLYLRDSPDARWSLSGGFKNIGFRVEKHNLPISVHACGSTALDESVVIACEVEVFSDGIMKIKGAVEFNTRQKFFLRFGYISELNNSNESLGEWYERKLSLGFGIKIKETILMDYSWRPYGNLGSANMVSIIMEL
jgi:hypothetical protein